jgi:EmrB/QacA subfamily drug resistance transporter
VDSGSGKLPVVALLALALAIIAIANDFTALNVVLPSLESDYGIDLSTAQWVINAYTLVLAMLIVPGGRIADLYGRSRMFLAGAAVFVGFSAVAGAAPNEYVLIGARALMGIGGAVMWPALLGMTFDLFGPKRSGLAGGFVLGIGGFGNALGPVDGGVLTELWSWRLVFLINIPIGLFAMLVVWRSLHRPGLPDVDRTIDYWGIVTLGLTLLALLLALDDAPTVGWGDPLVIALLAASVVFGTAFVVIQKRRGMRALIPADLVRNRMFVVGCVSTAAIAGTFFLTMLYLPQIMQKSLDATALEAGIGMLPMLLVFAVASFIAGQFYDRLGPAVTVLGGVTLVTAGTVFMIFLPTDVAYVDLLPSLILFGLGFGGFQPTITTVAVTALDDSRSSLAGGILYMFTLGGGAVGLGAATTIVTSVSSTTRAPVDVSFIDGVSAAFVMALILSAMTVFLAIAIVRGQRRRSEKIPAPAGR